MEYPENKIIITLGEGQHGDKDIIVMGKEYLLAAEHNPVNYEPPAVCFLFPRGVTQSIHNNLKEIGVEPIGKVCDGMFLFISFFEWF